MTLKRKALLSLAVICVCFVTFASWSFYLRAQYASKLDEATGPIVRKLMITAQIKGDLVLLRLANRGLLEFSAIHNQARVDASNQQFDDTLKSLNTSFQTIEPMLVSEGGRKALAAMRSSVAEYVDRHKEIVDLCSQNKVEEAITRDMGNVGVGNAMIAAVDALIKQQGILADEASQNAKRLETQSWIVNSILMMLGLGSIAVVWVGITRLISALSMRTEELAESAEQVSSAAGQVSGSSQALAQGASEQAASIEETSASTHEIQSITESNAANTNAAAQAVERSRENIQAADARLRELVISMSEISDSSSQVSKILKVIDEIAFQTNILALNAAVEAARAGEAGAGFAVVADEVRNLAQRCAQAAKETTDLIQKSVASVTVGTEKVSIVERAVKTIVAEAANIKELVDQVSVSSAEQRKGLTQISSAIEQMEAVTQRNAATAEESAAAGEELNAQAGTLHEIAAAIRGLVQGTASAV